MGTVFMAEQTRPLNRLVTLKLIKAGMDSRQVLACFEVERQALAMMDHPNIAHVFDGGTTPSGRPYFVMELVKGTPIEYGNDSRQHAPLSSQFLHNNNRPVRSNGRNMWSAATHPPSQPASSWLPRLSRGRSSAS
jgi:hypothetical protein